MASRSLLGAAEGAGAKRHHMQLNLSACEVAYQHHEAMVLLLRCSREAWRHLHHIQCEDQAPQGVVLLAELQQQVLAPTPSATAQPSVMSVGKQTHNPWR